MVGTVCDNKSVGILVQKDQEVLLIERAKYPFGFALPAGHVDGDLDYEIAARRELWEETGLEAIQLELLVEARRENECRRGGRWHDWKIYRAQVIGNLQPNLQEVRQAVWCSPRQVQALAQRTRQYLAGEINEEEWQEHPGLEVVLLEWFENLGIVR